MNAGVRRSGYEANLALSDSYVTMDHMVTIYTMQCAIH